MQRQPRMFTKKLLALLQIVVATIAVSLLFEALSVTPRRAYAGEFVYQGAQTASLAMTETTVIHLPFVMRGHDPSQPRMLSPLPDAQVDTLIPLFEFYMGIQPPDTFGVLDYSTNPDPDRSGVVATFRIGDDPFWKIRGWRNLEAQSTYYWRIGILTEFDYENVDWSEQITFTTPASGSGIIPLSPSLRSPISGSIVMIESLVFEWEATPGAVEYNLLLEDIDADQRWGVVTTATQYVVAGSWLESSLVPGNRYTWSVIARNDYAWSAASPAWGIRVATDLTHRGLSPSEDEVILQTVPSQERAVRIRLP